MIASQYFLLRKQSKVAFIYDCQIDGEIFDTDTKCYQNMVKFHNIFLNSLRVIRNEMHLTNLTLITLQIYNYIILKMYPSIMDN